MPSPQSPGPPIAVSLRGVTKVYDSGVMALGPLDLDVRKGEFVSLLGPSGCGKSTALAPDRGPERADIRPVSGRPAAPAPRRRGSASCSRSRP